MLRMRYPLGQRVAGKLSPAGRNMGRSSQRRSLGGGLMETVPIVVDGCHEDGGFPGEPILEKKVSQEGWEHL